MSLTEGALARVMRGEDVTDFVVQVLGAKPIQSSGQDRYRLLVSDGAYSNSFIVLATQLNHLIQEKKLENFTIVKIKKQSKICNQVTGGKTMEIDGILMEIEVIPGAEVGRKIGSPVQIPSDGSAPPPPSATYNDETRVKHTVVGIEDVDYIAMNNFADNTILCGGDGRDGGGGGGGGGGAGLFGRGGVGGRPGRPGSWGEDGARGSGLGAGAGGKGGPPGLPGQPGAVGCTIM